MMTFRAKFWMLCLLAIGSAMLVGIGIGYTVPTKAGVENPTLVFPLLLGAWGIVGAAAWLWWKKTYDLQQMGQPISWYWGGLAGTVIMVAYMMVFFGRHSDVSLGATYLFFGQFAGFAIAWSIWRLRGRGHVE